MCVNLRDTFYRNSIGSCFVTQTISTKHLGTPIGCSTFHSFYLWTLIELNQEKSVSVLYTFDFDLMKIAPEQQTKRCNLFDFFYIFFWRDRSELWDWKCGFLISGHCICKKFSFSATPMLHSRWKCLQCWICCGDKIVTGLSDVGF